MATETVPGGDAHIADRRPLSEVEAEPIIATLDNAQAVMLLLSETQAEDDHITHIGQLMLDLIAKAKEQLARLEVRDHG